MTIRLLDAFRRLFDGQRYLHRDSSLGDRVSVELFEDLCEVGRAKGLIASVDNQERGVGPKNKAVTLERMRRGDGTLGILINPLKARRFPTYRVARGEIATIDVGAEVKILNKAMIKQIDRVVNDLEKQVKNWRDLSGDVVTFAVVGINHASHAVGYEGDREYRTDGNTHKHPIQEAETAKRRIVERIVSRRIYDEVLVLNYSATNESPFPFEWVNAASTQQAYQAALIRLSKLIEQRL